MTQPAQVLLITTEDQKAEFSLLENSNMKDPKMELVTRPQIELYEKEEYVIPSNASEGTILLLNPFAPKQYVNIEDNFEIIKSRLELINDIAKYLGIRKVAYELSQTEIRNEKRELKVNAKIKGWDNGLNVKSVKDKNLSKVLINCKSFGEYTIEERKKMYETAKEIVQQYPTLQADEEIRRLFRDRNPETPLKGGGESYCFNMTSEVNSSLDIAASIRYIDPKIFSIGIKAQREINTKTMFSLRYVCVWDMENADPVHQEHFNIIADKWKRITEGNTKLFGIFE